MEAGATAYLGGMQPPGSLVDRYKPQSLDDMILSPKHNLALSFQFHRSPYPEAFLAHGRPGLGKTTLANILAKRASHPLCISRFCGPDLNSDTIRQIGARFGTPPLYGGLYSIIVNEADKIPQLAQIRLLDLLDRLKELSLVMFFTSNEELSDFESRFLSRVKSQPFTSQGLAPRAVDWLVKIAAVENIPLSRREAARVVKNSHNNLRACLQELELRGAEHMVMAPTSLPDAPAPKDTVPTSGKAVANNRQTAAF